jgi:CspA family cold shock protein
MPAGTVERFGAGRCDGFIVPDDGEADSSVHASSVRRAGLQSLNQGQRLAYDRNRDNGRDSLPSTCALAR